MKILDRNVYLGPSLYAHFPTIRLTLDLGDLEEWPSVRLGESFAESLLEKLPGLKNHGCSYREEGGFLRRMREDEGTWLGHIFEHVVIELQQMAGISVTFGKTRSNGEYGQYDVVFQYEKEEVGLEAAKLGLRLLHNILPAEAPVDNLRDIDFDWEEERDQFIRFAQRRAFGPSTASLVKAAEERDIPWMRLNPYSLVQLGHACYGKKIQATITSETRHIGVEIASDKEETNKMLGDLGLPVANQRLVYTEREAVRAANRIGFPVVLKPLNANHGRGVSINLKDDASVQAAFENAKIHSRSVIVESFLSGFDHRLLVVDGKLVAASKRVPGHVVGDGKSTIEELIEIVNQDPRRGIGHEKVLTKLELDYQANRLLELKGFAVDSVPVEGKIVYLRSTGNLSTGGTAVDVTDVMHPDNRDMAERAARAVGLDVCGVDFLTEDITVSYKVGGGGICEVNAAPGFRMHVAPSEGTSRDVAGPVMDMLFPEGSPARIPIASITGTNGKTTTSRMVSHIFKMTGKVTGLTSTDGVYIDGHLTVNGDMTGPASARMVLRDPKVEVAVLETARGGLLRSGLGYRRSDVGAVLNVAADHLGLRGIETVEELAKVKRIVVEVAKDTAVLNADDRLCLEMADRTKAENLCYVTMNSDHALVRKHIQANGRAVVLERGMGGNMIAIYDKGQHIPLLWAHLIPATLDGRAAHNVQNAMFAAGIAFSMGVSLEDIRHGLRTFDTTFFQAPGRMNIFDDHPFKVVMDYGHNPAAVKAMVDLTERMEAQGKNILVLSAPGDRRDEDIREIAALCAGKFDHYICRRDDNLRGRESDEIPMMLRDALIANGVSEDSIELIPEEQNAVQRSLEMAEQDDLLLIFVDAISRTWKQIQDFQPEGMESSGSNPKSEAATEFGSFGGFEQGNLGGMDFETEVELIRDSRGVRVAVAEETD
ncbi:MAG TPA: cyanophycin synthetase [Planctomycetota bacterium]|jgi:cyanophycin synthetase|nr:cyanophycin synthetase [Planctomycetota bacterium]HJM38505.1 cyanophycin synthetase [Planctomycetota bacterium]|tara:strand:- start:23951 stop:26764 length:2814 start_codon:yes stop_codon:yes gene_type:complete